MSDDFDDIDLGDVIESEIMEGDVATPDWPELDGLVPTSEWPEEEVCLKRRPDIPPIIGIQRHRLTTDGEGITTLVAFHGCPLSCRWCINPQCHNKSYEDFPQLTVQQLYERLKMDDLYFRYSGGGVTFGGGEPLLYPDFIDEAGRLFAERGWKITVETSLNVPTGNLRKILRTVDRYIVDVKDMNESIYHHYTGIYNSKVKENLLILAEEGLASDVVIRVPLIPEYNTENDVERSICLLKEMGYENFDRFRYVIPNKHISESGHHPSGKSICEMLKNIRKEIAEKFSIDYTLTDCHYDGDCPGTCPKCEHELSWLTDEVAKAERADKDRVLGAFDRNEERKTLTGGFTTFQDQVDGTVAKMLIRVKKEMPVFGRFAPIMEFFPNLGDIKWVGKYGLQVTTLPEDIQPDRKMRHIIAVAYEPTGNYKATIGVEHGHKKDIVKMLQDPEFAKKLNGIYGELVEILRDFEWH